MASPSIRMSAVLLFTALLASTGCTSLETGAREEFSKEFSCPADRVEVTPRPDLKSFEVIFGPRSAPPSDIAADPGRLEVWRKRQDELEGNWNRGGTVFQVRGCSHDVIYACSRAQTHANTSNGIICSTGQSTHAAKTPKAK
jgi:hypothetical protein